MARRYNEIKGLAEFTAKTIVSSEEVAAFRRGYPFFVVGL